MTFFDEIQEDDVVAFTEVNQEAIYELLETGQCFVELTKIDGPSSFYNLSLTAVPTTLKEINE